SRVSVSIVSSTPIVRPLTVCLPKSELKSRRMSSRITQCGTLSLPLDVNSRSRSPMARRELYDYFQRYPYIASSAMVILVTGFGLLAEPLLHAANLDTV